MQPVPRIAVSLRDLPAKASLRITRCRKLLHAVGFYESLRKIVARAPSEKWLILGDLNARVKQGAPGSWDVCEGQAERGGG
jgi:hypothetical protein